MENQKIIVLNELLDAFDKKNFDLESWKIKASILIKKIFGNTDEKVNLIKSLQYDYSSWSLRDHSGGKPHDPVKDQAREIIETSIAEIKLSGSESSIYEILKEHLTGAQLKKIEEALKSSPNVDTIIPLIKEINNDTKNTILAKLLLNE
jgi:hypothetical protein